MVKEYYRRVFFIFFCLVFIGINSFAQLSVSATGTNGSCPNSSSVTATAVNNSGTVNYRLLKVVSSGDSAVSNYTSSNIFTGLPDGTYVVAVTDFSSKDTSNSVTVVSTYTTMTATASVGSVTCANNDTTLTVTVSGGNAPYTYAITSPAAQVQTVSTSATSYTFHNLPVANYGFSVTDACGNTVVTSSSISSTGPATNSVHGINESGGKGSWFVYGQRTNVCTDGINIFIRWAYAGTNTLVSNSTATQLFWRYRYPSGSGGTVYGAGGVANGMRVDLNTNYLALASSTDTYPFSHGGTADLIVYDACGDSTVLSNYVNAWTGAQCRQTIASSVDNCTNAGIVTPKVDLLTLTCLPYVYSFTDQTDPSQPVIRDTIYAGNTGVTFSGFIPGHTYAVTDKDADSLTLNNCVSTITITTAKSHIVYFDETPSVNAKNVSNVRVQYPTVYTGTVTLKILAAPAGAPSPDMVGYTTSFLQTGSQINFINSNFGGVAANGFYSGTYSLKITAGCWNDTLNFTIPKSFDGSITSDSTKPTCGGSIIAIRARLDNPSNYSAIIMSGTSGVGTKESFNTTPIADSGKVNGEFLYISNPFSVPLGTYKIGLLINGGTVPIDSVTVTDLAADQITIDAGNTGGFVCPGNTTGTLVVAATSSAGASLQYSQDGGVTFQTSSIFPGDAVGVYHVVVKDNCGTATSYNASIVPGGSVQATINGNFGSATICAGDPVSLNVGLPGANTYSWTGPNGFTSNIKNPVISGTATGVSAAGTYTVTSTSTCVLTNSVTLNVNALPTVTASATPATVCGTAGTTTIQLNGNVSGGSGTYNYLWTGQSGNGITTTNTQNTTAKPTATVVDTLIVTDAITGCVGSDTTAIIVVSPCTSLPVTFICFAAKAVDNTAVLTWSTAGEINNNYFEVQRNLGQNNWTSIGRVTGSNTTSVRHNYTYTDNAVSGTLVYYRLMQVDNNGAITFSDVRLVKFPENDWRVTVYPNPVPMSIDAVQIQSTQPLKEMLLITTAGQVVQSIKLEGQNQSSYSINTKALGAGVYVIHLVNNNNLTTNVKLVKRN